MPWTWKIAYGFIADNFPILESRRKSYLIINSISMSLVLLVIAFNISSDEVFITALLMI